MSTFTADEKAKEAQRETAMRKAVYGVSPTLLRRIAIMQEIADEYFELAKKDQLL